MAGFQLIIIELFFYVLSESAKHLWKELKPSQQKILEPLAQVRTLWVQYERKNG